jgi:hypothetical protein
MTNKCCLDHAVLWNNKSGARSIRSNRPVPADRMVYYFELKVLSVDSGGHVGLGFAPQTCPLVNTILG